MSQPWLSQRTRTLRQVAWLIFGVDVILAVILFLLSGGTAIMFPLSGLWMISLAGWALSRHVDIRNYIGRRTR
jgi:uncharacterized membrane protein